jgi:hypothetical protein
MGWKNALSYLKGLGTKHGVIEDQARKDANLPLGARIGSLVTLQASPFVTAELAGSLLSTPEMLQDVVRSIGHVKLNFPGNIYRLYLETGDDDTKPERFIQIVVDPAGVVVERMYCQRLCRFVPATDDDQAAFTGEGGYGLGAITYALGREQLEQAGLDPERIQTAVGEAPELVFEREAGNAFDEFVVPFKGSETRIDDAAGTRGLEQSIWFMPYMRSLGSVTEHLLITTELVNSKDGSDGKRSIHVDMTLGIQLDESRLSIQ